MTRGFHELVCLSSIEGGGEGDGAAAGPALQAGPTLVDCSSSLCAVSVRDRLGSDSVGDVLASGDAVALVSGPFESGETGGIVSAAFVIA